MGEIAKEIDLNELKLHLYAEFETWDDFVNAVDEFQKKTFIKLTIITSKKLKTVEEARRKSRKMILDHSDDEDEDKMKGRKKGDKSRFEYQYLKLTCKHYGRYVSTSKGIRPNQKTAKLECPTFLYASYDHYKDKFIIKQMHVSCNHELKDEDVALPKLLQKFITHDNDSSYPSSPKEKKKYIKIQNRNVIKIPLESPTLGALIVNVNKKIKCNHEINSVCQAASLTNDDLMSIHSLFIDKKKKEQNEMIVEWITLNNVELNDSNISKHLKLSREENDGEAVLIQFNLPTLDGSLINVCFKAFTSILNITNSRVNEVILDHYTRITKNSSNNSENNNLVKNREIETSIATILTSFNNTNNSEQVNEVLEVVDGENQQLMIIDTVDVPTTENTIEDPFNHQDQRLVPEEVVTTSTIVPVEINEKRFELSFIPWWKQTDKDLDFPHVLECYGKLDIKRSILILKLSFNENSFDTEIYAQLINPNEHPILEQIVRDFKSISDINSVLTKFDSLALCRGISDPQLKNYANEIKSNSNSTFTYCYYSDSVRSKCCELLYDQNWDFGMCRYCYSILDNVN